MFFIGQKANRFRRAGLLPQKHGQREASYLTGTDFTLLFLLTWIVFIPLSKRKLGLNKSGKKHSVS
jgi:hypothetical protein